MSRLGLLGMLLSGVWVVTCSRAVPRTEQTPAWVLDPPPTEEALVDRLRTMVKTDPVSAVGLAAQGDHRFPGSPMSEVRALLAIRALVKLNMVGAAQLRAKDYYSRYPDGWHSDFVASLTGVGPPLRPDGGQRARD